VAQTPRQFQRGGKGEADDESILMEQLAGAGCGDVLKRETKSAQATRSAAAGPFEGEQQDEP
jgi:hypothetical protein